MNEEIEKKENKVTFVKESQGGGNREYASDVFSMLMEYPKYALEVYNALNGSSYKDPGMVQIVTLKKGISLSVRNDASFIVGGDLQFYEHQTTHNPNMPLRELIYHTDYLKQWIEANSIDLFGRKQIQIPAPHFVVFYNGTEKRPDAEEMKLSDAFFPKGRGGDVEVKCKVYNVNRGRNRWLLDNCKVLNDYGIFVDEIRENRRNGIKLEEAIDKAIEDCIEKNVLKEFLEERKSEVRKTVVLDFTWERREQLIRKEEFADGMEAGRAEGRAVRKENERLKQLLEENNPHVRH